MSYELADRVRETTSTTGTGTLTLLGSPTTYFTFNSSIPSGSTVPYLIEGGGQVEGGRGTFTAPDQLSRDVVIFSNNGGSLVNFTTGTKDVFLTILSEDIGGGSGSPEYANGLLDFATDDGTTQYLTGLTYGYNSGVIRVDTISTNVPSGTFTCTNSASNYVECTGAGVVQHNTTGFTIGRFPMAVVIAAGGVITSIGDSRGFSVIPTITNRVVTITTSSTPTPNADVTDEYVVDALASSATFGAPTGTPSDGQGMIFRIKDNGTARALAWNAVYRGIGSILPTTTVAGKNLYIPMMYNTGAGSWDVFTPSQEI